jgi:hypothetical protein
MNKIKSRSQAATNLKMFFSSRARRVTGIASFIAAVVLGGSAHAATIADFGTTAPTPGANDVSQLTGGTADDLAGNTYYSDKNPPPGQTFTTGSNTSGYGLTSLYVKTGGYDANNTGTAQTYTLRIYSVSGSTATLLSTYVTDNVLGFTDGTWLQYSGLTNILQPNTVYAYTHQRNTVGWDGMSAVLGNLYAGGQACNIPTAGGAITFGSSGNMDGTFMARLLPITDPFVFPTAITPASAVAGTSVVITAGVGSGTAPISYQWQFTGTNGIATKISGATNITYTIAAVQTTNQGSYSLIVSNNPGGTPTRITNTPASLAVRAAYNISTIGTTAPTPGIYDIAQLTLGTDLGGLNYFADNATPPGQTFTTGANPAGYSLTAIYLKTAGVNSSATGTAKTYTLRLYSISGSTATLLSTYLTDNTVGFTDGDWLRYAGMTNVLQPNTVYAYTHRQNGSGWDQISAVYGDLYANGQACLIPQAGGAVSFGTNGMDAAFQVSMVPNGFPAVQIVSISPANSGGNPVYAGTPVTLSATAIGAAPLVYKWQTDSGLGGAFSDVPSSNTNSFGINTTGMSPGTYNYQVIVTNVNSSATSSVVTLNLVAASGPVLVTDTVVNPSFVTVGTPIQVSAAFTGTLPITYQWRFTDTNSITTSISGATTSTYNIASAQLANTGTYSLVASNAVGGAVTVTSTPAQLTVVTLGQANTTSAGIFDATSTPPTPGAYDIAQLIAAPPTSVPVLNYYVDNFTPPGQTFTTGNTPPTPAGYQLSSLYLQEELSTAGGNGGGNGTDAQSYTLGIYAVSSNNAALLTSYVSTNTLAITEGDWIQWTGLTNIFRTNSTYAFSIHRNGGGWWKVGNNSTASDVYAGGQVASLPGSGYGAMVFSSDSTIDAGFLIGLTAVPTNSVNTNPTNIVASVAGNVLHLSWPADHTGWRLLVQTNHLATGISLNTNDWTTVAGSAGINQTNIMVDPAKKTEFYRLTYP